ncbi:hypothetical protein [Halorientalis halophila]|uniref:hypothetical protein n=1 Tax=Halorientalis halophila TaxID=3108499 RepID=UPI003008171B
MRRFAIALLVGGVLALTMVAAPAAGAQTETQGNETVLGIGVDAWTVSGVTVDGADNESVERARQALAANLSVPAENVRLQPENETAEVYGANLTLAGIGAGFEAAGFSPDTVRRGVTEATRNEIVGVLRNRLGARGLNATAETVTVDGSQHVVVTGASPRTVTEIVRNRGTVSAVAHFPVEMGSTTVYRQRTILTQDDFVGVGPGAASRPYTDRPSVEVHLDPRAAREAAVFLKEAGFTEEGVTGCPDDAAENPDEAEGYCLYSVVNGEVVTATSLGGDLAWSIDFENYEEDPSVLLYTDTAEQATQLSMTLRTGAFPVPLSVTEVPESVARAALASEDDPLDDEVDVGSDPINVTTTAAPPETTTEPEPETTEPPTEAPPTEESSPETAAATTDDSDGPVTVTDSGALGPGFTPLTALLAVALASVALLSRRVR